MKWKIFQGLVALGFVIANIHFEWGVHGIAVPVIGGMLAWYATGLVAAVVERWTYRGVKRPKLPPRGHLDAWAPPAASREPK